MLIDETYQFVLNLQRPHKATADEMTKFHSDEYIRFLRSIRPDNMTEYNKQMQRCKYKQNFFYAFKCIHYIRNCLESLY